MVAETLLRFRGLSTRLKISADRSFCSPPRADRMPTKAAREKQISRRANEIATVFKEGSYTAPQITNITRLIRDGLNESEWSNFRSRHDLPGGARRSIGLIIAGYWFFRADQTISREFPAKLDNVVRLLKKLSKDLGGLRADSNFFKGIYAYYGPSPIEQAEKIDQAVASLHEVNALLDQSYERITRPSNRPTHRGIWQGIATLEAHMRSWGEQFTEDQKQFAYEVFHLADPMVSQQMFGSVLREYFSIRPKWDSTEVWVEHKHR
jgi:hypothetical protein